MVRSRSVTSARSAGGAASSISRASLGRGAGNWRGSSRGWCSPEPSRAMRYITEMSKAITINNSSESLDVAIRHSNSSGIVCQCDLATPFDGLGQGGVCISIYKYKTLPSSACQWIDQSALLLY